MNRSVDKQRPFIYRTPVRVVFPSARGFFLSCLLEVLFLRMLTDNVKLYYFLLILWVSSWGDFYDFNNLLHPITSFFFQELRGKLRCP